MRFIKMTGGLGNQMFIYAFYLGMKHLYPRVRIDLSDMVHYKAHYGYELHRMFNLPNDEFCTWQPLKKVVEFLFFKKIYEKKQSQTNLRAYTKKYLWPLLYFKGFYQSERYFASIKDEVKKAFSFDTSKASSATRSLISRIEADPLAVSLHVRRGDYLQPGVWENTGCVCQLPYYENAVGEMKKRVPAAHWYVFSDDIEWVRQNLRLDNAEYVDFNRGEDSWQDMLLMSRCSHHIICNSTFSWWGAWLGRNPDKVVLVPEKWFNTAAAPNIYPAQWIKVPIK